MSEFEAGISYQNKRYKVKFPWKPNMKTLLENNEDIARKRFLKLRSRFKNDSSLFEDYKLVVNNYLSEKIIERVPFEEENLKHNIFYLPHRAVLRTEKTTSKLRIVFDASSHAKAQLSLNDCLHTGLNFIPNLFFLLIKFRVNPIAFVADIKMAFLMIEIDESERDFTRFFWDENPGIYLENKRLDIFRMTRVLFGVKSSPFLLAATIKHHLKKYVDIFPDTFTRLNQSMYVDDFLCGNVSVQAALTTCIESKQILEDARTFLSKRINTKRYLLEAAGRLFDPVGFIGPYTIRIKCLIQEIWCLGLDWDDKLPKQLEVSWKKWCNEIHYLSEIKIPRYYFQNFLPSNATTIQLHCFSDASKKAYETVAYLRIELNDGNIISSFVASKGRVAPLKTLSIPRLELMWAHFYLQG
ncbi:reverse transcriptase domain-containing protein [Trichonephila clavipes]|nr:reverse transcriptase domain-containing protein [Trichonephila clavipes]